MAKMPKYFMYFPGNYRWSAAFVNMLGRGSFGGAEISELHKIGRLLEGKGAEDDEAWFDAFLRVADEVRGHAERFRQTGHPVSAASFYLRACHYYQMGERFRTPKDAPRARRLPHRRRLLPSVRRPDRREDRDRRGAVRGRQPARVFRARAERASRDGRPASCSSTGSTSPRRSSSSPACPT